MTVMHIFQIMLAIGSSTCDGIILVESHLPLVPHTCFNESGQRCFRWWLVAYSAPGHYLNQCWVIINWTLRNKLQWNFDQNAKVFIYENASKNIVCEMAAIFDLGRLIKLLIAMMTIAALPALAVLCSIHFDYGICVLEKRIFSVLRE